MSATDSAGPIRESSDQFAHIEVHGIDYIPTKERHGRGTKPKRTRLSPAARSATILDASAQMAGESGLDRVTLSGVATRLGTTDSLLVHYFGTVDELLAATFSMLATTDLERAFADVDAAPTPLAGVEALLARLVGTNGDAASSIWLDGWYTARRRPAVAREVVRLNAAWIERLSALLVGGVEAGEFRVKDPVGSSARIMAAVDGLSLARPTLGEVVDHATVGSLVYMVTEHELGLLPGALAGHRGRQVRKGKEGR